MAVEVVGIPEIAEQRGKERAPQLYRENRENIQVHACFHVGCFHLRLFGVPHDF